MAVMPPPVTSTIGISVVEAAIDGKLDADAVPDLRSAMQDVLALRPRSIVIDLAGCTFIDAAGVALLLEVHRCAWLFDGRVVLRSPCPQVQTVLRIIRVERILQLEQPPPRQITAATGPCRPRRDGARPRRRAQ